MAFQAQQAPQYQQAAGQVGQMFSRVGKAHMTWAQAKRDRDERAAAIKVQRERDDADRQEREQAREQASMMEGFKAIGDAATEYKGMEAAQQRWEQKLAADKGSFELDKEKFAHEKAMDMRPSAKFAMDQQKLQIDQYKLYQTEVQEGRIDPKITGFDTWAEEELGVTGVSGGRDHATFDKGKVPSSPTGEVDEAAATGGKIGRKYGTVKQPISKVEDVVAPDEMEGATETFVAGKLTVPAAHEQGVEWSKGEMLKQEALRREEEEIRQDEIEEAKKGRIGPGRAGDTGIEESQLARLEQAKIEAARSQPSKKIVERRSEVREEQRRLTEEERLREAGVGKARGRAGEVSLDQQGRKERPTRQPGAGASSYPPQRKPETKKEAAIREAKEQIAKKAARRKSIRDVRQKEQQERRTAQYGATPSETISGTETKPGARQEFDKPAGEDEFAAEKKRQDKVKEAKEKAKRHEALEARKREAAKPVMDKLNKMDKEIRKLEQKKNRSASESNYLLTLKDNREAVWQKYRKTKQKTIEAMK